LGLGVRLGLGVAELVPAGLVIVARRACLGLGLGSVPGFALVLGLGLGFALGLGLGLAFALGLGLGLGLR
jgi:hypothetical protein